MNDITLTISDSDIEQLRHKYGNDTPIDSIIALIIKTDIKVGSNIKELSEKLRSVGNLSTQLSDDLVKLKRIHEDTVTDIIIKSKSMVTEVKEESSLLDKAKDIISKLDDL